jgi:hypothetical protein
MTRTSVLVLAVVLLGLGSVRAAEKAYPTNIELLEQAVAAAVGQMDVVPPDGRSPDLEIDAITGSEGAWLVEDALKGRLIATGWKVKARAATPDTTALSSDFLLKTRVTDLGLIYGRSWKRYLVTGKMVERIARVSISYDLVDRTGGNVVVSSSSNREVRDKVPASKLASLGDPKYGFASPALEKSQWDRYVEGTLVLAIVGILVYLFYSNKTAS